MRIRVKVIGVVQGVGFRYFVREAAQSSRLKGWVRNLDDGSVEALLDGAEEDVTRVLELCKRGPPSASVHKVVVTPETTTSPLMGFRIAD